MAINTEIYGAPETWGTSNMTGAGFKWVNFNATTGEKPRLLNGAELDKTPHGEIIENSVCTQALGTESKYCHIIIENAGELYHCDFDYISWFLSESDDTERNSQNNVSTIQLDNHINSWKPYRPSTYYWNYSDYCRPFAEWKHKKLLFNLKVQLRTGVDVVSTPAVYSIWDITPEILAEYPYISFAYLETYVDNSATDTPNRIGVNQYSQFGISPNVEFDIANIENFQIDYACFKSMLNNAIPLWGMNTISFNEGSNIINIGLCDEEDVHIYSNGVVCAREYTEDFKEYLIQQAACLGLFVRIANDSEIDNSIIPLDNNDIILGVLDEYETGHGEYTRGAENRNNKIWSWSTNRDSNFDPYTPPIPTDPNTYSDTTTFNFIGGLSSMFKRYVLNAAGVDALGQQLFKIGDDIVVDQSDSYQDYQEIILNNFLTNNPVDAIISLKKYPLVNIPHADTSEQLRLGKKQISVVGYRFPYTNFRYLFGAIDVYPRFKNTFLDYAPFTTLEIYVPFCGTKELDTGIYMGHKLSVELQIDFTTGSCDAYIKCDNLVTDTLSGQCAIDIPVTGTESATVDSQITNGIIQGKAARGKATTDFASANFTPSGWVKSITDPFAAASNRFENKLNRAGAEYNVTHSQTPLRSVGTSTPVGGWTIDFNCRLFITYPTGSVINNENPPSFNDEELKQYGHINGFATVEAATMANFKIQGAPSFVVADSINLDGIAATETEKDLIRAACKEGCYI